MKNQYFQAFNNKHIPLSLHEIAKDALQNKIPIICNDGLLYLTQIIRLTQAKKILEIGTAIGYSAIAMALVDKSIHIDTLEINEDMYQQAVLNIKKAKCSQQIRVLCIDALLVDIKDLDKTYDLIFIDAAKAQYIKFFGKFELLLKTKGVIVSDNLLFHGLVNNKDTIASRNLRALVRKIEDYNQWLAKNKKYHTTFLSIGDGMAVSEKL